MLKVLPLSNGGSTFSYSQVFKQIGAKAKYHLVMLAPPPGGTGPGGYSAGAAPSSKGGLLRARPLPGPQMAERERIQAGEGSGAKAV